MSTTIASIVEKFAMEIEGPPPGRDAWFLDYVLRSPKQAGRHLTAGWLALQSVRDIEILHKPFSIETVQEYFGGMGAQAMMVQEIWHPGTHVVQEYSMEAVSHLETVLPHPHRVDVRHVDAYSPAEDPFDKWFGYYGGETPDMVVLDFGDLTVWKTREGEQHRELLDRVFARQPKAVVFTDIACRYLHLHRERYENLLGEGTCRTYEEYLYALLGRLEDLYGYTLHVGFMDRWSTVMALVPVGTEGAIGVLAETPDSPVGLELL